MARLTAAARRRLPASAFVFPKSRKYPIHDRTHARVALAYARRNGVYGKVAAKVKRRYPDMAVGGKRRKRRRR
jgi:hypothetical protein